VAPLLIVFPINDQHRRLIPEPDIFRRVRVIHFDDRLDCVHVDTTFLGILDRGLRPFRLKHVQQDIVRMIDTVIDHLIGGFRQHRAVENHFLFHTAYEPVQKDECKFPFVT
jgi:hypothetical protein